MKMLALGLLLLSPLALAWEGRDHANNTDVEIEEGTQVLKGEWIEFFDRTTGQYHTGSIESVGNTSAGTVEVKVYDETIDANRTFEMEKD